MLKKDDVEQFYRSYYGKMCRLAGVMLHDAEEGRDVASDVFAQVAEGRIQLPPDREEAYLLLCVRNRCLDVIARMKVRERMMRHLTLNVLPTMVPVNEREQKIERMLHYAENEFAPQTLKVFQLRYDRKKSYREIAEALDISETSVYKHLSKALVKLKKFADHDE